MKWTEVLEIAIQLSEVHPDVDPKTVRFTDLHNWVVALAEFVVDSWRGGEKVLEAFLLAWIVDVD